jgi:hypothetical protein
MEPGSHHSQGGGKRRPCRRPSPSLSSPQAVVEEHDTVAKATLGDEFQVKPNVLGKCSLTAADDDRRQEQLALVYEPDPESLGGQVGAADTDVTIVRAFIFRIALGSKLRSIWDLALDTVSSERE